MGLCLHLKVKIVFLSYLNVFHILIFQTALFVEINVLFLQIETFVLTTGKKVFNFTFKKVN